MGESTRRTTVQFDEDGVPTASGIVVKEESTNIFTIYLGILQQNHKYKLEVPINKGYDDLNSARRSIKSNSQSDITVEDIVKDKSGCVLVVNYIARAAENRQVVIGVEPTTMTLNFTSKILRPNMGVPVLKDGVHLIGKEEAKK